MFGETAQEALEVYYFTDTTGMTVKLDGNYLDYPNKVCILSDSGTNAGLLLRNHEGHWKLTFISFHCKIMPDLADS